MDAQLPVYIHNPYCWSALTALFLGLALSRLTFFTPNRHTRKNPDLENRNRDKGKTAKWIFVCIYLSMALGVALAGVLLCDPARIADIRLLIFFGALTFVFSFAFRFKKSVGILTVFMVLSLIGVVLLIVQSLNAFTGETLVATIGVLDVDEKNMTLELAFPGEEPVILDMAGEYFAPIVKVVIFDDYFVFLGEKTWYRFVGLTSFSLEKQQDGITLRQMDSDYYLPQPRGISEILYSVFERHEDTIPGIKSVQIEIDAKRARSLRTYSILIQNDGGVQIVDTE